MPSTYGELNPQLLLMTDVEEVADKSTSRISSVSIPPKERNTKMEILMFIIFGFMIVRSVIPSPTDDSNANQNRRIAVSQSDQQALVDSIGNDAFPGCFTAMTEEKFKQYEKVRKQQTLCLEEGNLTDLEFQSGIVL
ncbi:MAG: hypothetical protein M1822_006297 [Bathelium mastoideum]|nr:MAG: hypothetical protein M1822_006297 [Bathelium mastoideum]